ncbi:hypothetical protein BaRGS_00015561 [Batillaria attramentaria]|uniref:Uncharacterized protein n=1 Tax=Batillaria attramentaria TaxID=370345 RepID=A0ABD0L294_9CAEN
MGDEGSFGVGLKKEKQEDNAERTGIDFPLPPIFTLVRNTRGEKGWTSWVHPQPWVTATVCLSSGGLSLSENEGLMV